MTAAHVERRLAAILAADVVSYSRLMSRDEMGTLKRVRAQHASAVAPAVQRHGGRIFKLMGDGLLAEFPSVVEAVRCAVVIQTDLSMHDADLPEDQRLRIRIGVHLGDIIPDGGDTRRSSAGAASDGTCVTKGRSAAKGNSIPACTPAVNDRLSRPSILPPSSRVSMPATVSVRIPSGVPSDMSRPSRPAALAH